MPVHSDDLMPVDFEVLEQGGETDEITVNGVMEMLRLDRARVFRRGWPRFIQGAGPRTLEEMLRLNRDQYGRPGPATVVNVLPGGLYRVWVSGTGWDGIMAGRGGIDIAFSDRSGTNWIRRATGRLEELSSSPLDHFEQWGLAAPHDFQLAERVARE